MPDEDFWRTFINNMSLTNDLPDWEPVEGVSEEEPNPKTEILNRDAAVLRFRFDLYVITPLGEGNQAYMVTGNQKMEDLGVMLISEAVKMIQKRKK